MRRADPGMVREAPARTAVTVARFVAGLQAGLQELYPGRFWVEGEIGSYKVIRNGHAFFALKDEKSQVEAVCWRSDRERLPFAPEDGQRVLARVRKVDFYGPSGRLRVQIDLVEPHGEGALARALEERRARLLAEGLFDQSRKRTPPYLPRVVGIATAGGSAALEDMLKILRQRFADRHVLVRACRVQGAGAAEDIAAALDDLNRDGRAEVILLGRGGGSAEDLWSFNEEAVVRAIARSKIAIITGIGHEIDTTLADLVADLRAPTPTAAAQICVPDRRDLEMQLRSLGSRLDKGIGARLQFARARLRPGEVALRDPRRTLTLRRAALAGLAVRAQDLLGRLTPSSRARLQHLAGRLRLRLPRHDLVARELVEYGTRLEASMRRQVEQARASYQVHAGKVDALSPLAVLDRGFSVARRVNGMIVRDADALEVGDELLLRFARGEAHARVESIPTPGNPRGGDSEEEA